MKRSLEIITPGWGKKDWKAVEDAWRTALHLPAPATTITSTWAMFGSMMIIFENTAFKTTSGGNAE